MLWYIAAGSALGGVSRYLLGGWMQQLTNTTFPIGTLTVNVVGSFLLGLLIRYTASTTAVSPEMRGMLTIGFCGGFTTFSTFSLETVSLLESGDLRRAAWYATLSVLVALAAMVLGIASAHSILDMRRGG